MVTWRRVIDPREKASLQPWRRPYAGPTRKLDADEQREMAHLYQTKQATAEALAARFGVSRRTVYRYLGVYPERHEYEAAAKRIAKEAAMFGIYLTRDDALRLAIAAMSKPYEAAA